MSGVQKEARTDSVAGSSTMIEPPMMVEGEGYFNSEQPAPAWTTSACSQLCRMCATENEYLIPIFDGEGVEHQLGMKIDKHLPIRVHVGDTLPLHVCYQCASTLIAWHDLVVGCIEAEKKLLQIQSHGRAEGQVEEVDVKSSDTSLFYAEQMDSEQSHDPNAVPGTSAASARLPPKKTVPKANPKLKMVIVKTPSLAAASSRIITPKTEAIPDTTERRGGVCAFRKPLCSKLPKKRRLWPEYVDTSSETPVKQDQLVVDVDPLAYLETEMCDASESAPTYRKAKRPAAAAKKKPSPKPARRKPPAVDAADVVVAAESAPRRGKRGPKPKVPVPGVDVDVTCVFCLKEYKTKRHLARHVHGSHPDPENAEVILCDVCGAPYATTQQLRNHKRTHKPRPPPREFACEVCGKVFAHLQTLQLHGITHTDERPHVCATCGKTFQHRKTMLVHERTHTKARPFACVACGKTFGRLYHLSTHMRIHTGLKPYACDACDEQFVYHNDRVRHRARVHGIVKQAKEPA